MISEVSRKSDIFLFVLGGAVIQAEIAAAVSLLPGFSLSPVQQEVTAGLLLIAAIIWLLLTKDLNLILMGMAMQRKICFKSPPDGECLIC
jgi:hypothetical protein